MGRRGKKERARRRLSSILKIVLPLCVSCSFLQCEYARNTDPHSIKKQASTTRTSWRINCTHARVVY